MGKALSICCCCKCETAEKIKKELRRNKDVEVIYKQISCQNGYGFPCDIEVPYI